MFNRTSMRWCLVFAALACSIRPTSDVIWVYMICVLFWRLRSRKSVLLSVVFDAIIIATITCSVIFVLDSLYYRKLTFTPLNFLLTNLSSVSLFYGSSPWHYYLSQALPILCTSTLPFALHGFWTTCKRAVMPQRIALGCIVWTIAVYSAAGHKEWRFLHPLLPLLHIFASKSLIDLHRSSRQKKFHRSAASEKSVSPTLFTSYFPPIQTSHLLLILTTLPFSLYVVLFYGDAPISVMTYLRTLPEAELQGGSIGFLMPCHSTPWLAYLHRKELSDQGTMWALGCEPPLQNQLLDNYRDQTDIFYESPFDYLQTYFPPEVNTSFPPSPLPSLPPGVVIMGDITWKHEWPRYLIMFGVLLEDYGVRQILEDRGYNEVWKAGRKWEGDGKRKGGARVWKFVEKQ